MSEPARQRHGASSFSPQVLAPADYVDEIGSLRTKVAEVYARLNGRLWSMAAVFDEAAGELDRAVRFAR